jgi:hypothetical protein
VTAIHDNMNKIHIEKQSQDMESNLCLVYGTICQNPEIEQLKLCEETGCIEGNSLVY